MDLWDVLASGGLGGAVAWVVTKVTTHFAKKEVDQLYAERLKDYEAKINERLAEHKAKLDWGLEDLRGLVQRRTAKLSRLDEIRVELLARLYADLTRFRLRLLHPPNVLQQDDVFAVARKLRADFEAQAIFLPRAIETLVDQFVKRGEIQAITRATAEPASGLALAAKNQEILADLDPILLEIKTEARSLLGDETEPAPGHARG